MEKKTRAERRRDQKLQRKEVVYVCVSCGTEFEPRPVLDLERQEVIFVKPIPGEDKCKYCGGALRRKRVK